MVMLGCRLHFYEISTKLGAVIYFSHPQWAVAKIKNRMTRNIKKETDVHFEPPHGKTNNLHRRKTKAQISFAVTAKLISAFVFATRIVQFLFYLNPKFQASSSFLCLYRPVCVGPMFGNHIAGFPTRRLI